MKGVPHGRAQTMGDDVEEEYAYDPKVGGITMKAGDRVRVDFNSLSFKKGTIQEVYSNGKSYKIKYDENDDVIDTGTYEHIAVENIKYNIKYTKMTGREVADELREMSNYHYEKENKTWYPRLFRVLVGEMVRMINRYSSYIRTYLYYLFIRKILIMPSTRWCWCAR